MLGELPCCLTVANCITYKVFQWVLIIKLLFIYIHAHLTLPLLFPVLRPLRSCDNDFSVLFHFVLSPHLPLQLSLSFTAPFML